MPRSGSPPPGLGVPPPVLALAGDGPVTPVWVNGLGGTTFAIGAGGWRRFVKWAPAGSGLDLGRGGGPAALGRPLHPGPGTAGRGHRPGRIVDRHPCPARPDGGRRPVDGRPRAAVTAIGQGLRALHEALPVQDYQFSWTAAARLSDTHRRAALGLIDPARWHPEHQHLDVPAALGLLADIPPDDQLVVCHGDPLRPLNTLLGRRRPPGPATSTSAALGVCRPLGRPGRRPPGSHVLELRPRLAAPAASTPTAIAPTWPAPATTACWDLARESHPPHLIKIEQVINLTCLFGQPLLFCSIDYFFRTGRCPCLQDRLTRIPPQSPATPFPPRTG